MCWFLTDKFRTCWSQFSFQNWRWCQSPLIGALSSVHPSDSKLFFIAEWNCILTLSLCFIYSGSRKSHIMTTARSPDKVSQPTQLPLTVRWYWISDQAMGSHFFSVQRTVQSEWWLIQELFQLLTYCCSYMPEIQLNFIMKLPLFWGFISVQLQFYFS